jgi:hypothetical protein
VTIGDDGQLARESPDFQASAAVPTELMGDGRVWGKMCLEPHELVFVTRCSADHGVGATTVRKADHTLTVSDMWSMSPVGGNLLPLGLCAREARGGESIVLAATLPRPEFAATPDGRFLEGVEPVHGTGNGWGVMCGSYPLTAFPPGSQWWVRAEFEAQSVPEDLELVFEDLGVGEVLLNGRPVQTPEACIVWDSGNLRASVARLVRPGPNTLLLRVAIPAWEGPHALPLLVVRGSFEVAPDGVLVAPGRARACGDWRTKGYPRFSGTMRYRAPIEVPPDAACAGMAEIHIADAAEAVTLAVNGQVEGERAWPPYRFDVAGRLAAGTNDIELLVSSTSANLFGDGSPSGLLGPVTLRWAG